MFARQLGRALAIVERHHLVTSGALADVALGQGYGAADRASERAAERDAERDGATATVVAPVTPARDATRQVRDDQAPTKEKERDVAERDVRTREARVLPELEERQHTRGRRGR